VLFLCVEEVVFEVVFECFDVGVLFDLLRERVPNC
jgi:hypothetical protein